MQEAAPLEGLTVQHRLQGVDVLRGLAVLLVVLHHIHLRFVINRYDVGDLAPPFVAKVLFWSGYYSVIAFFVISGFLITGLSLRRWGSLDRIDLPAFYRLRVARILPCLLALLAVLSVLHLSGATGFVIAPEKASLGRALLATLTFHFNWLEGHRGYLPGNWDVLWSLSVEEAFYVAFPLMCVALRRERWMFACLVMLIAIGPFNRVALEGQEPWEEYAYLSCADGLAFGCIAAWVAARVNLTRSALRVALTLGTAAVLLIVVFRTQAFNLGLTKVGLNVSVLELGIALILLALAGGVGNTALSHGTSFVQLVGRCSYEIYLTHMFVVMLMMQAFKSVFGRTSSSAAWFWATYALMLTLSILLGWVVARWLSEPLNRLLRRPVATEAGPP